MFSIEVFMQKISVKRDRKSTEKKIKEAAYELFARKGFKATTVRMISENSGCNVTLISRYFGGKEDLFKAILNDEFKLLADLDIDYPETKSLSEELTYFFKLCIDIVNKKMDFFRMLIRMAVDEPLYGRMIGNIQQSGEDILVCRLERLIKNKDMETDVELEKLSHMIMIYMNGLVFRRFIVNDINENNVNREVENYLDHIIN